MLDDEVIRRIADGRGKSPAQVVLRWHIQRGDIVFPKSVSPDPMRANFDLFDFELDGADMDAISALDRGESGRIGPNLNNFDYIRLVIEVDLHDGVEEVRIVTASGDYAFVPPYVPHREENPDPRTHAVIVIARSTRDAIVVNLPRLYALSEETE